MPHLLELSNEILLSICDYLDLTSVQALSYCNQFMYEFTEQKRYASISFTHHPCPTGTRVHPLIFLNKILLSPRIASYPQIITLGPMDHWRKSYDERIAEELKYDMCTAMSSHGMVPRKDFEYWYQQLSPPYEYQEDRWDFSVALIIMSLPNIRVITNHSRGRVVKRIQTSARLKVNNPFFRPIGLYIDKSQVLSKVHEINIDSFNYEEDPHFVLELCFLSSAKVIRVGGLWFSPTNIPIVYEGPILNPWVEEIEVLKSYVRDDQFERLIQGVKGLRRLKYDHYGPQHIWRPTKLISTLILHARHSCTHLDLTTKGERWLPITCGFRELEVLKDLRLDSFLLDCRRPTFDKQFALNRMGATYHESNNFGLSLPRIIDILPASIEHFTLIGHIDCEQMERLLDGLIAKKGKILPLLTKIKLEVFYTGRVKYCPDDSTRRCLEDVGIAIERKILGLLNPGKG